MKRHAKQIAAGEFKAKCLQIMDEVQQTHAPIIISKRGVPIVKLVPVENEPIDVFGMLKGSVTINEDIIASIEERWEADE